MGGCCTGSCSFLTGAERDCDLVGDERAGIGQRQHVAEGDEHPLPASGLALDDRERRGALRREDVPGEQRQRSGEAPLVGERLADLLGGFLAALDRVDRAERGDRDLARRHAGNERDVDLPVEADRRGERLQPFADDGGEAVVDRGPGRALRRTRERRQEPDQHHHREDRGAGALQEHHGARVEADGDAAQLRNLVVGQFQHEWRRGVVAPEEMIGDERHAERAENAGGVEAEHHEALQAEEAPDLPVGNERRDDQRINRDARRAGHQRRDQNRGDAVALVVDDARRHDSGNGAGET